VKKGPYSLLFTELINIFLNINIKKESLIFEFMTLEECSICGVSGSKIRLLEAVSIKGRGIVKVCDYCSKKENLPVLKRPTTFQLRESEGNFVSRNASGRRVQNDEREITESKLKEIVNKNYESLVPKDKKPRPDLVEHFHWIIMRGRRKKKLTQEQLAKELSESTAAIRMAENGILPDNDYVLVNKLESFLGIRLIRNLILVESTSNVKQPARVLKFDPNAMKSLTIDDLRRMKGNTFVPSDKTDIKSEAKVESEESDDDGNLPSVFGEKNFNKKAEFG